MIIKNWVHLKKKGEYFERNSSLRKITLETSQFRRTQACDPIEPQNRCEGRRLG